MTVLLFNFSTIYEDLKCNIQSFLFFRPPGKASSNDQRLNVFSIILLSPNLQQLEFRIVPKSAVPNANTGSC